MKVTEKNLLENIIKKDHEAMKTFYDRFEKLLFSVAFRLTDNKFKAERLLQSVIQDIWKTPHLFLKIEGVHLSSYLVKYTIEKHKNNLRRKIS